jgi:hypothetical protein
MLIVPERPIKRASEASHQSYEMKPAAPRARSQRAIGHAEVLALPRVTRGTVDYSSSSSATARSTAATLPDVLASG